MPKRLWFLLLVLAATPALAIPPPPIPPAPPGVTMYSPKDLTTEPSALARQMMGDMADRMVEYRDGRFYGRPTAGYYGICQVESIRPFLMPDGVQPRREGVYVSTITIGGRYTRVDVPAMDWRATQEACANLGPRPHYFDAPSAYVAGRAIALWELALAGAGKARAYKATCNFSKPCDPRAAIARMDGAEIMLIDWTMPVLNSDRPSYRLIVRKGGESLIVTVYPKPYRGPPAMSEVPEELEAVHVGI